MSDSLRPHRLQHTRLPCLSPTPRTCTNSCLSSWWCHPTISSSVIPFSSCLQSFPASGSFLMSQLFASSGHSISPSGWKPFTSAWDLNPCGWGSNPAKIHGTWFQGLIKLRFFMSHHRKNSARDKMIGKKWIYSDSEQNILHRQSMGHRRGQVWPWNLAWLVFIGWVSSYANEWEDYSNCFWEGVEISRIWATAHSLVI